MGAEGLVEVLKKVAPFDHPWLDRNVGSMEDAALLRPQSGAPFVFTVDFITPIVDDPETFGAIAAANSLSDVYAMGGDPQVALAVCGFPEDLPQEILVRIFQGGRDKAAEAGCAIVGGHTVLDPELKYGLCVIGTLPPGRSLAQTGTCVGDRLVLTKPLGCGIAAQAIKKGRLPADGIVQAVHSMTMLNRGAKDAALAAGATAATDVTGFGLLGHLHHLVAAAGHGARVHTGSVPVFDFVRPLAEAGVVPGGTKKNLRYVTPHTRFDAALSDVDRLILCDAQTSGGLLIAVPAANAAKLLAELARQGTLAAAVVGEVVAAAPGKAGEIEVVPGR